MGKPTICICENKGADQLSSYCEADQRLCFCYTDSTIPLLLISKISSIQHFSVCVAALFVSDLFKNHIVGFSHEAAHLYINRIPTEDGHPVIIQSLT